MIDLETRGLDKLLNPKEVKIAQTRTLNSVAFGTRDEGQNNIEKRFINRNKWVKRSVRVRKATWAKLESATGTAEEYMETQELGGTESSTGRYGVSVPLPVASGESSSPRRRLVRANNKMARIDLTARRSKRISLYAQAMQQARTGARWAFVNQSFFKLTRIRRRRGVIKGFKMRKVYDLSNRTIHINKNPWLEPAADRVAPWSGRIFEGEIEKILKR